MGLQPLEFSECLTDSPHFREKLHAHEKELARTSKTIKILISQCKDLLQAANNFSKAQRILSKTLIDFRFECIGSEQTDDEIVIVNSLKEFGKLLSSVEDERDKIVQAAVGSVLEPLEKFRKEQIGEAKEGKRKFDKETTKYLQSLDRYLNMKQNKSNETQLLEADASLEMESKHFYQESMKYVLLLQAVQERKKFEFVEILLQFVLGWLTFYHQGYEVAKDFDPFKTDLTQKLQKCRDNFETTREEAKTLMEKMLEVRGPKPQEHSSMCRKCAHEGYLFMMEKIGDIIDMVTCAEALTTAWTKYYCQYRKESRTLTMVAYNQTVGKGTSGLSTDTLMLASCTRRATDSIEKRFCFDVIVQDRSAPLTFQALSEEDRRLWLDAMDGKEPVYAEPAKKIDSLLDDIGFSFIKRCIAAVEARGLEDEGLYRIVGVNSKVTKLTSMLLDRRKADRVDLNDRKSEWEMKTVTSAIKNYFRSLPEPLMTFRLHQKFINAAKQESRTLRINDIHELVHQLPESNFEMLDVLIAHLCKVSEYSTKNLMSISNIGVCFGPTLMRPEEETVAAIMDIKFCNLVIEILIENYEKIFKTAPEFADVANTRVLNSSKALAQKPPSLSSSQTSSTGGSFPSSSGPSSVAPSAANARTVHQSNYAQSYLTAANANQSNSNPVMRSAVSRSVAGPSVYANVAVSADPVVTTSSRTRMQPSDRQSSASSSCDSLNVKATSSSMMSSSTYSTSTVDASNAARSRPDQNYAASGFASSLTGSSMSGSVTQSHDLGRKVRTLYACEAENDSELSFEPNQIITNVRQSREPGWLEGVLSGKKGLIPNNYVEFLT